MTTKNSNTLISGIHHPNVGTTDYPEALDFFTDVFGMRLVAWYLMHGAKNSDHALVAYSNDRNSGFFSLCNRPEMNKLAPIPGLTSPTGPSDTVAPGAMQSISFHVASDKALNDAHVHIQSKGYDVSNITDRGYEKSFSFNGPSQMKLYISLDLGIKSGQRDLIDMEAAAEMGLSEAEVAAAVNPSPEPEVIVETPNPSFFDSKYKFGLTKETAVAAHLPDDLLNWLMTDTIPPTKAKTPGAFFKNAQKMFVALPWVIKLKLQGKLKVTQ